jgi:antitoxin component YwqK of YwqJK toxin-antitoxin module
MKIKLGILSVAALLFMISLSCKHILPQKDDNIAANDTIVNSEFSGVKRFMSGDKLIKEVTFKNGIKEGLNSNYYDDGRLRSTIIYKNGLRSDTAKWYYPEGDLYRATPYTNDTINGTQLKYHKNGRLMAELPYKMGLRMPGLKEYYEDGRPGDVIPSIMAEINQSKYESEGVVRIILKLSNESNNVKFYRGSLVDGVFNPDRSKEITISSGMGLTELKTDTVNGQGYLDIIAVYTTRFRNKEILTKRVKLPYNNLK